MINYTSNPYDIKCLIKGVKEAKKVMDTPPLKNNITRFRDIKENNWTD